MSFSAEAYYALIGRERRGPLAMLARLGLRVASVPYGLGIRTRNWLFDRGWKQASVVNVPVVSIGNLSLGGTGKTPCVEYVARFYRELGLQVAILSRGYGATAGRNDEALVLEENLPDVPHLQGADRAKLALTAVEELEAELLVLDDGFQHRRLRRNLDIVLIDATRPATRDWLFPRGTLREPLSGLGRAGIVMLTRCDQASEVDTLVAALAERFPTIPVVQTEHRPVSLLRDDFEEPLDRLNGHRVAGFCGLGNPSGFWRTLEGLGASIIDFRTFPDHHPYSASDVAELNAWAEKFPIETVIVTTQKDIVKLRIAEMGGKPLFALKIGLGFLNGEEEFCTRLRSVLTEGV